MRNVLILVRVSITSAFLLSGCRPSYSKNEVQRVVSPSGRVEAVTYETNGGATTSFGYEVDLLKSGDGETKDVAEIYGALRSEGAYGVNVV